MQIKHYLHENCIIQIHNGSSSIWSTPWCPVWNSIHEHINLPITIDKLPNSISELWLPQSQDWDINLLSRIFDEQATRCIVNLPVVPSDENVILRWVPGKKNLYCSTKDAFCFLLNDVQDNIVENGARGISAQALNILKRIWKNKAISPCIKTFSWRLIRRALATGQRAGRLSQRIQKECTVCNMIENDSHLFFHCSFARAVWFSATPPLLTSNLQQEEDGVHEILSAIITSNTKDDEIQRIILYGTFGKRGTTFASIIKKWSALQVHYATAAEIKLTMSDLIDNRDQNADILTNAGTEETPILEDSRLQDMQNSMRNDTIENNGHNHDQMGQQTDFLFAGTTSQGSNHNEEQATNLPRPPHYRISLPATLPGTRCYTDASTTPDNNMQVERPAGLGIFMLTGRLNNTSTIYIKAKMRSCNTVIMAEAAALALAAQILRALDVQQPNFLSDNQQVVTFLNGVNHINSKLGDQAIHTGLHQCQLS